MMLSRPCDCLFPKVRPQRKPAKPDLASTEHQEQDGRDEDVEDSLSIVDGILQQTFSKWQSGSLNVIDEEEAIGAVARSSVGDLPTEKAQALAFMQQDDFAEEQLGGCKHGTALTPTCSTAIYGHTANFC